MQTLTKPIQMPPSEQISQAGWWAVQKCRKRTYEGVKPPDRDANFKGPAEDQVDVDLTASITNELETEHQWPGETTQADLKGLVVVDAEGNEIEGARILARYEMSATAE